VTLKLAEIPIPDIEADRDKLKKLMESFLRKPAEVLANSNAKLEMEKFINVCKLAS
jgi:hypothetical protein